MTRWIQTIKNVIKNLNKNINQNICFCSKTRLIVFLVPLNMINYIYLNGYSIKCKKSLKIFVQKILKKVL